MFTVISFKAYIRNQAPVAQLDRVIGFEPIGREFESLRARQVNHGLIVQGKPFFLPVGQFSIKVTGSAFAENLGNGAIAKCRFLVPDSRSAGRFYVACGVKLQGIATRRQVIWSLCLDPLLGRDEVTRTNRGRRRHKRSRDFCRLLKQEARSKLSQK